ncbi:MAG TPA: amino acid permease [Oscillospiraceae bacterium]|nr:amino acid permease [Oscillospiraceae bacterium]
MKKQKKGLGAWQLTMLALGTVIGGSFFLGCSVAIHAAGPSVVAGFIFGGVLVYFILYALSEMTVANPGTGSFRAFASQAFGPGTGFVVGWIYWTGMVLAMSSEAAAVSTLVRAWFPAASTAWLGGGIIAAVTLLNLLGASKLSRLESVLAAVKIFAIAAFIAMAALLIVGLFPGRAAVGLGALKTEALLPGGISGLAGSMLVVMFTYAGFEIIGLAASETDRPKETIPKAIRYTVVSLVGLYVVFILLLLPIVPTDEINENTSPIVLALQKSGLTWAGTAMNVVLITAILSTMLAAMFALGRMMRSLTEEHMAPGWLRDKGDVPYRGILCSGLAMLAALRFGLFFPRVYLFLISSGGFALLFSYVVIMATHIRFRQKNGCPPDGKCQMWGFPYTSLFVLLSLVAAIASMPFVPGQLSGLTAGACLVAFYAGCYAVVRYAGERKRSAGPGLPRFVKTEPGEFSEELDASGRNEDPPG